MWTTEYIKHYIYIINKTEYVLRVPDILTNSVYLHTFNDTRNTGRAYSIKVDKHKTSRQRHEHRQVICNMNISTLLTSDNGGHATGRLFCQSRQNKDGARMKRQVNAWRNDAGHREWWINVDTSLLTGNEQVWTLPCSPEMVNKCGHFSAHRKWWKSVDTTKLTGNGGQVWTQPSSLEKLDKCGHYSAHRKWWTSVETTLLTGNGEKQIRARIFKTNCEM